MSNLKIEYSQIVNKYLIMFVKKQGYEFSYWVSDDVGGMACFIEQYFFSFDDIRTDIDKKAREGLIFEWQDDGLENQEKTPMNYSSYISGLRFSDLS